MIFEKQDSESSISVESQVKEGVNPEVSDRSTVSGMSKAKRITIALLVPIFVTILLYMLFIKEEKNESALELNKNISEEDLERIYDNAKKVAETSEDNISKQDTLNESSILQEFPELELPEIPKVKPREQRSRTSEDFSNPFAFQKKEIQDKKPKDQGVDNISQLSQKQNPKTKKMPPPSSSQQLQVGSPPSSTKNNESFKAKMMIQSKGKKSNKDSPEDAESFIDGAQQETKVNHRSPLPKTSAKQVTNSYFGERGAMLLQGKIIEIVLETAINTDLEGSLRGIVASDVFAEAGNNILLPKGTRAIGSYSSSIKSGQSRVEISWERFIRPDSSDVITKAQGTDQLGRTGVSGEFDAHISTSIRNSVLVSIVTILSGVMLEQIFNNDVVTKTVGNDGNVTTSSSVAYSETQDAFSDITDNIEDALDKTLPGKPTIRINAGTVIKAFVTEDIVFLENTSKTYIAKPKKRSSK